MNLKTCNSCGKQTDEKAQFCIHCGSKLDMKAVKDGAYNSGFSRTLIKFIAENRIITTIVVMLAVVILVVFVYPTIKSKWLIAESEALIERGQQMDDEGYFKMIEANKLRGKAEERWAESDRDKLLSEANELMDESYELMDEGQRLIEEGESLIREGKKLNNDYRLSKEEKDQFIALVEEKIVPNEYKNSIINRKTINYEYKNFEFKHIGDGKYEVTFDYYLNGVKKAKFISKYDSINEDPNKVTMIDVKEKYIDSIDATQYSKKDNLNESYKNQNMYLVIAGSYTTKKEAIKEHKRFASHLGAGEDTFAVHLSDHFEGLRRGYWIIVEGTETRDGAFDEASWTTRGGFKPYVKFVKKVCDEEIFIQSK